MFYENRSWIKCRLCHIASSRFDFYSFFFTLLRRGLIEIFVSLPSSGFTWQLKEVCKVKLVMAKKWFSEQLQFINLKGECRNTKGAFASVRKDDRTSIVWLTSIASKRSFSLTKHNLKKMDFKVFLKREWLEKHNEWMRGWDHCQGLPQISCRMSVRPSCPSFFPPPTPGQWPHNRTPKKEAQKGWDGISHFLFIG